MENIFQAEADAQNLVSGGRKNIKRMLAKDKPKQRTETNFPFFGHGKIASEIGITDNSLLLKESSVECPKMKNRQATPISKDVTIRYSPNACFADIGSTKLFIGFSITVLPDSCIRQNGNTESETCRIRESDLRHGFQTGIFACKPIIPTRMLCAARGWPIPCISRRSIPKL